MKAEHTTTRFGATYSTEPGDMFGEITGIFEVPADWDGHKFHGYCWAPESMVREWDRALAQQIKASPEQWGIA